MLAKLSLLFAGVLAVAPAGASHAWPGEVAVVSGNRLVLITANETHPLKLAGTPSQPAWSPDGRWVAFLQDGALWAARSDGADAHRVSPARLSVSAFYWVPRRHGEMVAFSASTATSAKGTVFLASAQSKATYVVGTYPDLVSFSVAPSGNELAISYREGSPPSGTKPPTWKGILRVVPLAGGPGRVVHTLPAGGYALLGPGWWPNGRGLLFWDDAAGSASIAADGLPLDSLDLATGKASTLATTLTYNNWVSWSPGGGRLALVAGPNRVIWDSGKSLRICEVLAARCKQVPPVGKSTMALDPAWAADGSLLYNVAPGTSSPSASVPPGVKVLGNAPFDQATLAEWYGQMKLYVTSPSGAGSHPLPGAPAGAHDPLTTPLGVFFVRSRGLFWLAKGASQPAEVAAGLTSPGYYGAGSYYGYVAWRDAFAWHA